MIDLEKFIYSEAAKCEKLECDGAARVLHYSLDKNAIPHYVFFGKVTFGSETIPAHFWIVLADGRIVDFKAKMWLGDNAPNGIFSPDETSAIYSGRVVELSVSDFMYSVLTEII
jgi:hypothetical protein